MKRWVTAAIAACALALGGVAVAQEQETPGITLEPGVRITVACAQPPSGFSADGWASAAKRTELRPWYRQRLTILRPDVEAEEWIPLSEVRVAHVSHRVSVGRKRLYRITVRRVGEQKPVTWRGC